MSSGPVRCRTLEISNVGKDAANKPREGVEWARRQMMVACRLIGTAHSVENSFKGNDGGESCLP